MSILRAPVWNEGCQRLRRGTFVPSATSRITRTPNGQMLELLPAGAGFLHPWTLQAEWDAEQEAWRARIVVPGFVNGLDPIVPGSAGQRLPQDAALGDMSVCESPWVRLPLRLPTGLAGDQVPKYFEGLGWRPEKEPEFLLGGPGGVQVVDDPTKTEEPSRRQLRASELYLAVARATYTSTTQVVDPTGATGRAVDYSVSYDTSRLDQVGARARVMSAGVYPEIRRPTALERLMGVVQDEGEDRQRIATVWLLSPEDAKGEIDETWTPHVQYHCFWNLLHGGKNTPPRESPPPIRLVTGLAGGLGDFIANATLATINDLGDKVFQAVNNTTPEGRFQSA